MSPPPRSRHAEYQAEIALQLGGRLRGGRCLVECPLQTSEGVKAIDVAWITHERRASCPNDPAYLVAPDICVEVESPSNSRAELEERRRLCFEKGARECWLCSLAGELTHFDPAGPITRSGICPDFPTRVILD